MTILKMRNVIARGLYEGTGRIAILANQLEHEPAPPYLYYQPVQPYIPLGTSEIIYQEDAMLRTELVEATISIVACSYDREQDGGMVYGDDEALELAEKAISWLLHGGVPWLMDQGVVVVEIGNVTDRTGIEVDEVARRYGFDLRLRYTRIDTRPSSNIAAGAVRQQGG